MPQREVCISLRRSLSLPHLGMPSQNYPCIIRCRSINILALSTLKTTGLQVLCISGENKNMGNIGNLFLFIFLKEAEGSPQLWATRKKRIVDSGQNSGKSKVAKMLID